MARQIPAIGNWYQDLTDNQIFEVVAVDEHTGTIDIQYAGGEIAEFDIDSWIQLPLAPAEAPEDFNASYTLAAEDCFDPDMPMHPEDWSGPLSSIEPESFTGYDDY
ncbi:MAG: hypothetical protein K6L73_10640 [Cellvibrionaceae bacterium]